MQTKNQISLTRKTLSGIMLFGLLFSAFGAGNLPAAYAQDVSKDTSTLEMPETQYDPLISNSLLLYASTVLDFDTQKFLSQQNGILKNYSEEIDGQVWTAADSIEYNAILYGINPQAILVLLEAQDNLVTELSSQIPLRVNPSDDPQNEPKFYYHIKWLAEIVSLSFNMRRDHEDNGEIIFESGDTIIVPLNLNAGTYGVQALLSKILPISQWLLWTTGSEPIFKQTFNNWFGNPMLDPDIQDISSFALPSSYNLPFPVGSTWYFTGGPHTYTSSGARPWSSVDFAPPEVTACSSGSTTYNASRWIVAARGGTVITSQTALVVIDHGDGWRTYYSHVSTTDRRGAGGINQNDNLGHPSCEVEPGGSTTGIHVHFAIYQVGTGFVNITGSSLSEWTISETSHYNGTMTRQGVTRTATTGRSNGTNDIFNSGTNSGGSLNPPSLQSPSVGQTLNNRSVNFTWQSPNSTNQNGYTIRLSSSSNPDTQPWLVDTGLGNQNLSYSYTFPSDGTFYWHMRTWNTSNQASSWVTRSFNISTSGGGGSNSWTARYFSGHDHWWDNNNFNNQMCQETINTTGLDKDYGSSAPCGNGVSDNWVAEYNATVNFPSGSYVIYAQNDDGLKIWVNGSNIMERGGSSGYYPRCPALNLSGNVPIRAILNEEGGDARVKITWSTDTSVCIPPGNFNKYSPSNGATNISTSPTLAWESSQYATSYYYCIDTSNNNNCDTGWQSMGNTTSKALSGLLAGTAYYWQARSNSEGGEVFANSGTWWSFTTQAPSPAVPTGVSSSDGTYTDRVRISWTAPSGATSYEVYRNSSNSSSGASFIGSPSASPFDDTSAGVGTTYWYFVKACNSSGCSDFSASDSGYRAAVSIPDDNYEQNDTLATAYDLSNLEQTWLSAINGYGKQADFDWYRIYVTPGYVRVLVDVRFTHSQGDIDIALYDSAGNILAVSQGITDNEYIGYTVPTGDAYYFIKVYYADLGNQYNLWWDDIQPGVDVYIGGAPRGSYSLTTGSSTRQSYPGVNAGPVQITNSNTAPIIGAERVIYNVGGKPVSFSEMMGLPASQVSTTYWMPWYNNVDLDTQLRFGNVSGSPASVHVYIGGVEMTGSPFSLTASGAGQSTRVSFAGINGGPVKIVSDVAIVAAERVIYNVGGGPTSFIEMMGLPNSQLSTTYWMPWYNNVDLDTQLRFGNVSGSPASVHVYIGGVEMAGSPFSLTASGAGQSTRVSFTGINGGPVKIVSDVPIVASERVIYSVNGVPTSFSEMMGVPNALLNTTYWMPWYNNVDLDTQLRFGNVSGSSASVHVYIGGVEMAGSPFSLTASGAGQSMRISFAGTNGGPVKIVSDVPIVAAERVIYNVNGVPVSFSEMMGLPNNLLSTTYWLPWYNNVDLDTQLRFGVP